MAHVKEPAQDTNDPAGHELTAENKSFQPAVRSD